MFRIIHWVKFTVQNRLIVRDRSRVCGGGRISIGVQFRLDLELVLTTGLWLGLGLRTDL